MLSTVTYALSKKYADKVVEKATDGVVDKAVDRVMENITPELTKLSTDVNYCHKRTDENKDSIETIRNENKDFVETIRQGYVRHLSDFKGLGQYIDEERNPVYAWNGERYVVSYDGVVRRVIDKDYKCRVFNIPEFVKTEWVFDAYCSNTRKPIAILYLDTSYTPDEIPPDEIPPDKYVPIYATKVGPVDKTIILDRLRWEYPLYGSFLDGCRIILNSYQSEPRLYKHKFDKINVYTKDETDTLLNAKANSSDVYTKSETDTLLYSKANSSDVYTKTQTDAAIANAINSAITDVINTAY